MSLIKPDIAGEYLDDLKASVSRIAYQHVEKKDEYDSEEKFISDLVEKVTQRAFIENAHYTEKLVVTMLNELLSKK